MPEFNFQGRDKQGQLVQGKREGETSEGIATILIAEGIIPIQITLAKEKDDVTNQLETVLPFINKVSANDIIMFCRQMASLYKAGIPLSTAIVRLAESIRNPRFATALKNINQQLATGKTLATAMQSHPKIFSPFVTNLIRVGEESAQLDVIFSQIADYLELQDSNTKRIKTVFRYPITVITAIVIGVIIINIFVMPAFAKLYGNLHLELPLPTRILLATSSFIIQYWPYLLTAILLCSIAGYYYFKSTPGKWFWAKYQFRIPFIGNILERINLARIVSTLAITLRGGIPLVEGLNLIASATTNIYIRDRLLLLKAGLEQGETLTKAAQQVNLFSPLILQMLAVGEEIGRMDNLLMEVNRFYEQEVDFDLKTLAARLEPILLFAIAAMVLLLALGIFLPMWNIMQLVR